MVFYSFGKTYRLSDAALQTASQVFWSLIRCVSLVWKASIRYTWLCCFKIWVNLNLIALGFWRARIQTLMSELRGVQICNFDIWCRFEDDWERQKVFSYDLKLHLEILVTEAGVPIKSSFGFYWYAMLQTLLSQQTFAGNNPAKAYYLGMEKSSWQSDAGALCLHNYANNIPYILVLCMRYLLWLYQGGKHYNICFGAMHEVLAVTLFRWQILTIKVSAERLELIPDTVIAHSCKGVLVDSSWSLYRKALLHYCFLSKSGSAGFVVVTSCHVVSKTTASSPRSGGLSDVLLHIPHWYKFNFHEHITTTWIIK